MRILFLLFLFLSSLTAETLKEQLAQDAYLATVNAAMVLTSQDGLSSGVYRFTKIDTVMRMYNLHLLNHFDPLTENTNLFMALDIAYSDTRSDAAVDVNGTLLQLDNRLQTYVGGIGGGLRYRATEHSNLLFGGEILYSRVGITVRDKDGLSSSDVENFFSDGFNDNYSYKIFAAYRYRRKYRGYDIYTQLNYKLYKTLSELNFTDIVEGVVGDVVSLHSQTSVASLTLGFETDTIYCYHDMHLTLEPYAKGNYIWGDLATVTQVNSYATVGLGIYWNTPEKSGYVYRYFIEPSVSRGNGLEGLNLSLGANFDF
ncbi:MAG: hypothetical protein PF439_07520 [Helicobacteraceae bacterium]|jgi:hypothetical protein|nr:hypothetical protein [Helicobacteraceae bacterium]